MTTTKSTSLRFCPDCGSSMQSNPGYVTWCDRCNWNVQPISPPSTGMLDTIHRRLGDRLSRNLHQEILHARSLAPTLTPSKVAAYAIATVVHLLTLLLVAVGILLPLLAWPNLFAIAGGVLALAIAWVLRPRFDKRPPGILPRERFPALYRLVDAVIAELGAPPIEGIVIDHEFNASVFRYGVRGHRVLSLGLPLFWVLDPNERMALIGHEIGHIINGDMNRGLYIGRAIHTLDAWYYLIKPEGISEPQLGVPGLLMIVPNLVLAALAQGIYGMQYLLNSLLFRDSQRAEYLADHLATEAAGRDAVVRLLEKSHLHGTCSIAVQRVSIAMRDGDLFDELRRGMAELPERELERIRRVSRMEGSRLDRTHPPTAYRVEAIAMKGEQAPRIRLEASEVVTVENELRALHKEIQRVAVDQYLSGIYH